MDEETVSYLAQLARIELSDDEKCALNANIGKILDYMKDLDAVEVHDVQPCYHVIAQMSTPLADDEVADELPTQTFLDNAPDKVGSMVRVPPVIEK